MGDFSLDRRAWRVVVLSLVVGATSAVVALGLLDLIGLFTHLFYYGRPGVGLVQPSLHGLGAVSVLIPIAGGLAIGAMAYWGSERIRGHGIPEAMETILVGGSKVEPRLAVLKPISSAVSIGTGGPFGAEGPIILTGGALGSVIAQFFHLSASERRTLLVAGACGGMAAVFGTPVAATLFGVELLVFEWKPRSMVPIAAACAVAEVVRNSLAAHHLIVAAPLFPVAAHGPFSSVAVAAAAAVGLAGGCLAWALTAAVYGAEDGFKKLPIHWAWWPAMGGAIIGVGGLVDPRALGVGYVSINAELGGRIAVGGLATLLVVKLVIWSIGLGSGTSGGILAPLLIMGAAMGGLMAPVLPGGSSAMWALLGMAATLAGVTRSPLTSIVFAFELTHDTGSLLPLLVACATAHLLSTTVLRRSILTEKVARRGFHVVREYQVEPLEALFVRDAMLTDLVSASPDTPAADLRARHGSDPMARRQRLYPIVNADDTLLGVVTPSDLLHPDSPLPPAATASMITRKDVVVAHPDETLRTVADRMAEHWLGALPVVENDPDGRLVGVITEFDLLKARHRQLVEERHRERVLRIRHPTPLPTPAPMFPEDGIDSDSGCQAGTLNHP
ncbi:MAG: chloride channel protein [Acidimicrobiales bacterium]|nr:chloride channel protein [Acidimicrobiales bacterium]